MTAGKTADDRSELTEKAGVRPAFFSFGQGSNSSTRPLRANLGLSRAGQQVSELLNFCGDELSDFTHRAQLSLCPARDQSPDFCQQFGISVGGG